MNLIKIIGIAVIGYALFAYLSSSEQSQEEIISQSPWFEVQSKAHQFKVSFPTPFKQETRTINIPNSGRTKITLYQPADKKDPWKKCNIIAMSSLGSDKIYEDIESLISQEKNKIIKKTDARITDERALSQQGIKGYEYVLSANNNLIKQRSFINDNHFYTLSCFYKAKDDFEVKSNHFLDSFEMF